MSAWSSVNQLRRAWRMPLATTDLGRMILIGALPLTILLASPERFVASVAIAVGYLVAALLLVRPDRLDRPALVYAATAGAFMSIALAVAAPQEPAQRVYAVEKVGYFVVVVLPLGLAVSFLVRRAADIKPAAVTFLILGVALSIATLLLRTPALLGEQRYAWQGNLLAVAALVLLQYWILQRYWLATALAVASLSGLTIANSRQSIAAVIVGLPLVIAYWGYADLSAAATGRRLAAARRWVTPLLLVLGFLALLLILVYLADRRAQGLPVPDFVPDPKSCNCLAGRFLALLDTAGDRDQLLGTAWRMFREHPLFGTGPGTFLGQLATYRYPHNVPLEIAAEFGILGIVILIAPIAIGALRLAAAGARAASAAVATVLAILVVFAAAANLSGDLPSARAFWLFGIVALKLGLAPVESLDDRAFIEVAPSGTRERARSRTLFFLPMAVSALALVLLATIVGTATALVANRTGPPCQAASFTAAPQSPARVGSIIVFRPAAICADGPAEFSWYVKVPEEPGWALVQTWGTHEFVWNTSGLRPGVANVDMYARPLGKGGTGIDFSQDYRLEP